MYDKRIGFILTILAILFLVTSCGSKTDKATLVYEHVVIDDVSKITNTPEPTKSPDDKDDKDKDDDGKNNQDDDDPNGNSQNGNGKNGNGKNDDPGDDPKIDDTHNGSQGSTNGPEDDDGTFIIEGVKYTVTNDTVKIIATKCNIRKGPSTNHSSIKMAMAGDLFQRTAIGEGDWDQLQYDGQTVYVWNEYITKQ